MRSRRPTLLACAIASAAVAAASGCRRDEITHARVAKVHPSAPAVVASSSSSAAAPADLPAPPQPAGAGALRWTLPRGWTDAVAGGMRYATLKPPVEGRIDASVVVLSGPAGGELANVNRWRSQIGLPPVAEQDLASVRRTVATRMGPLAVYDFTSEGETKSRVIAGMAVAEGQTWFVKMTGDAGPVTTARPDFLRLLESLRLEDPR